MRSVLVLVFVIVATSAFGGEIDDLRKDLTIVQRRIAEEEARYQAAKAQMERSEIVAQFLFPELRKRENELMEKINKLGAEKTKTEAQ